MRAGLSLVKGTLSGWIITGKRYIIRAGLSLVKGTLSGLVYHWQKGHGSVSPCHPSSDIFKFKSYLCNKRKGKSVSYMWRDLIIP